MADDTLSSPPLASGDHVQTFARAVHTSLDARQIGEVATIMLSETLQTSHLSLYQADMSQPALHLRWLACASTRPRSSGLSLLSSFSSASDRLALLLCASQQRAPMLLMNAPDSDQTELTTLITSLSDPHSRSSLCLPLWCGETFEGVLLAEFATPHPISERDLSTLMQEGLHLASALALARLHLDAMQTRQHTREILEQLPEGIVVTEDTSGLIRYANPIAAQILGITLADLIGAPLQFPKPAFQPCPERQQPLFFWTFAVVRALSGETLHRVETVVVHPNGTQVPVLCSSTPLRTAQGRITGALLVLQDMTLQKRLERDKNAFLALASHELRTPLTSVLGYADLLLQIASNPGLLAHDPALLTVAANHISGEAEHIAFLIDEMLDLSSLDQDQLILHQTWHNLAQLLKQVVETLASTTDKHQLRLVLDASTVGEEDMVLVDPLRLTQALRNLVQNAIKYSPRGGEIEIGLQMEKFPLPQALLWVKDHGLGIAQEDLPHLFERFYRSQKLDRSISGLGIGLYLVHQIVSRHGGHLWVESTEGQGSTFYVKLSLTFFR